MSSYYLNPSSINFGSDCSGLRESFPGILGGSAGDWRSGSISVSQSLVLDNEKGELVKASGRVGKKGEGSEAKTTAALKSHSEAERRRRERINAHLATLRGLVPCTEKMDKATLLAEVVCQVKQLKKIATEATKGLPIPLDADEVRVEPLHEGAKDGTLSFVASICCDYRPKLLPDLRQALDALDLKIVKAEISTLGSRVKNVFVFTGSKEWSVDIAEAQEVVVSSVRQALSSILDKIYPSPEYSPQTALPSKRQRISFFDYSSSLS